MTEGNGQAFRDRLTTFVMSINEDAAAIEKARQQPDLTGFLLERLAEDAGHARHVWPERYTARMLAEVEAKRLLISASPGRWELCVLATIYADHADYREEWRA